MNNFVSLNRFRVNQINDENIVHNFNMSTSLISAMQYFSIYFMHLFQELIFKQPSPEAEACELLAVLYNFHSAYNKIQA